MKDSNQNNVKAVEYSEHPVRDLHFWLIALITFLITVYYYSNQALSFWFPALSLPFGFTKHSIDHLLYLIPVVYGYVAFNLRGGLIALLVSLLVVLPDALFISPNKTSAFIEICIIGVISIAILFRINSQRLHRERARITMQRLESTQKKLHLKVRDSIEQENRLAVITAFSAMLSQSLDIKQVIDTAIEMVMEVMKVEVVLIFSLDKQAKELRVTGFEGVKQEYATAVDGMKLGEGFCGRVAKTGKPLLIEDTSTDSELTTDDTRREKIRTQLSVPLRSRGKITGTLCASTRSPRQFTHSEIELLTAIGNLTGIAMENARLNNERETATEQLKQSEKKYRELFEHAQDAIWVQDLTGKITAANHAAADLFGCPLPELIGADTRRFLPIDEMPMSQKVRERLLAGQTMKQPYTKKLIKKDGNEAILTVTTNVISNNSHPNGFQFIGRDITKEVRMQENLSFYLQQITRAHEEERQRISRDLHDSTAQNLIATLHQLENFCQTDEYLPMPKLRLLWSLHEQLKDLLQEIRQLSRDLRPSILDDLGLLPAVDWLTEQIKLEHRITADLTISGSEKRFTPEIEVTLFRIIQEALRNIAKHAEATKAKVNIDFKDAETRVTISDNGKGFRLPSTLGDLSRHGKLGIDGMQTRARLVGGTFYVHSRNGEGTTITVSIPV